MARQRFFTALTGAVRRYHYDSAALTPGDLALLEAAELRPVEGGLNNVVYAFQCDGQRCCVKLYKVDERCRAEREWRALTLLTGQGYAHHPQPYYYDPAAHPPAVVMAFVEGYHLGRRSLSRAQLAALAGALRAMHAITPASSGAALWPIAGNVSMILARLRSYPADAPAAAGVKRWLDGPDPPLLAQPAPEVFSRGDPNLANCLWDGAHIRIVDYENSGWGDRALDLAEIVEHVQSRGTPDDAWRWFVEQFDLSEAGQRRFAAARRMACLHWLEIGRRRGTNPAWIETQAQRVQRLHGNEPSD
ncbi:MAG: phosphotransferase [Anaerolineae bacterium]|nr:phosphotransferase [Anaerolineae bacterium]